MKSAIPRLRQRGFFDFSFPELVIIFAVALVVLGPKKLPGVVAQIGRWVGRARTMARQFREQLEQEVNQVQSIKPVPYTYKPPNPAPVTPGAAAGTTHVHPPGQAASGGTVPEAAPGTSGATPAATGTVPGAADASQADQAAPWAPGVEHTADPAQPVRFALDGTQPVVLPAEAMQAAQPVPGATTGTTGSAATTATTAMTGTTGTTGTAGAAASAPDPAPGPPPGTAG